MAQSLRPAIPRPSPHFGVMVLSKVLKVGITWWDRWGCSTCLAFEGHCRILPRRYCINPHDTNGIANAAKPNVCLPKCVQHDSIWQSLQRITAFLPKHFRPFGQAHKNPTGLHWQGVHHHAERCLVRWSSGWIPSWCSCLCFWFDAPAEKQGTSDCCFVAMPWFPMVSQSADQGPLQCHLELWRSF